MHLFDELCVELQPSFRVSAHEVDPPARRARLLTRLLIGRAVGKTETAMYTVERSLVVELQKCAGRRRLEGLGHGL